MIIFEANEKPGDPGIGLAVREETLMEQIRVIHYLNQFFAGMGGEDRADVPLDFREGPMGPGKRLQVLLGDVAKIIATAYCGDNYFNEHHAEVLDKIHEYVKNHDIKMIVAGPAFAAGRYGFACVEICHFLSKNSGELYGLAGMSVENPGVDGYRQYKDQKVFLLPTSKIVTGMDDALARMAKFVSKLASGSAVGSALQEGYIPRGFRLDEVEDKTGAERATHMLLDKIAGRPFVSEIPIQIFERGAVAPRISNLKNARLALITTSGLVPWGNPDRFKSFRNNQWRKYSIANLSSMKDAKWDVIHGGYNTMFMYQNPNYGVPVDVCREMERKGVFAKLHPYFYGTNGVQALISVMEAIGKEIALDMKAEGVDGALLVAT